MRKTRSSQVLRKRWVTREISFRVKGKVPTYSRYGARVIHMWFSGDSWNHKKVLEHARRLKIFTSALMMGLLPHLYRIKYKWNSLNSANNPQKSEFQKGWEESNKVEKNILEPLPGNRTTVVIRVRIEVIKG